MVFPSLKFQTCYTSFFLQKKIGILISYQCRSVVCSSALTNGPFLGTLNFRNFSFSNLESTQQESKCKGVPWSHCKCISSLTFGCSNFKLCRCIGHMMKRVLGTILCDLDPKVKVKGPMM